MWRCRRCRKKCFLSGCRVAPAVSETGFRLLEGGHIVYAEPGHPEYRSYPVEGLLTVDAEEVA